MATSRSTVSDLPCSSAPVAPHLWTNWTLLNTWMSNVSLSWAKNTLAIKLLEFADRLIEMKLIAKHCVWRVCARNSGTHKKSQLNMLRPWGAFSRRKTHSQSCLKTGPSGAFRDTLYNRAKIFDSPASIHTSVRTLEKSTEFRQFSQLSAAGYLNPCGNERRRWRTQVNALPEKQCFQKRSHHYSHVTRSI